MTDDRDDADRQYTWGLRCAWADMQRGSIDGALGTGIYEALPHTDMFLRGYLALLRLPPAWRQWFLAQMTTRGTGA